MGMLEGMEASAPLSGFESALAGVRRLTLLADGARSAETMYRALGGELLSVPGAEEVHVHHLAGDDTAEDELVVVYMFDGHGRVSYALPRGERPPGVSWVASTGRACLIADASELERSIPRVLQSGDAAGALLLPLAPA